MWTKLQNATDQTENMKITLQEKAVEVEKLKREIILINEQLQSAYLKTDALQTTNRLLIEGQRNVKRDLNKQIDDLKHRFSNFALAEENFRQMSVYWNQALQEKTITIQNWNTWYENNFGAHNRT